MYIYRQKFIITKDEFNLEDSILKIPLWVFLLVVWTWVKKK